MLGDERADHRLERTTRRQCPGPARRRRDLTRASTLPGMGLPERGMTKDEIVAALAAKRAGDARWQEGRTFSLVYDGGAGVHEVAEAAAQMFLHENALNTKAFPSLGELQSEVVGACAGLLHAPDGAFVFNATAATESILLAVKASRERGRERGVSAPEMVVAES